MIENELERVKEVGPKTYENLQEIRVFILISSVLTWALTKPIDPVNISCWLTLKIDSE